MPLPRLISHLDTSSPALTHIHDTIPNFHTPSLSLTGSAKAARDHIAKLYDLNSEQAYLRDFTTHSKRLNLLLDKIEARLEDFKQAVLEPRALVQKMLSVYPTPLTPAEMKSIQNCQQQISKLLDTRPSTRDLGKAIVAEQDALLTLVRLMGRDIPKEHAHIVKNLKEFMNKSRREWSEALDDLASIETELPTLLNLFASILAGNMGNEADLMAS